ncbi:signal peptidase I [Actinoplanes sp. NPDC051851]|uniref:signal peptidase I n=1 Tax=Actinoplanes sp. NPDC051851 TaxID=3154753 RepID=UPI003426FA53
MDATEREGVRGRVLVGLLLLGMITPVAFGWRFSVVASGSMRPGVRPGDLVVTVPADELRPGDVIRFHDRNRPRRALLHRIARVRADGLLITKGDANAVVDRAPIPRSAVSGVLRLRIPYAGLPVLWLLTRTAR